MEPSEDGQPIDELGGADPFVITTRSDGARTVVTLTGELDLDATHGLLEAVRQALVKTSPDAVDLEMHGLNFLDSSGLQALLTAIGPVASKAAFERVQGLIAKGIAEGATVCHGDSPAASALPPLNG